MLLRRRDVFRNVSRQVMQSVSEGAEHAGQHRVVHLTALVRISACRVHRVPNSLPSRASSRRAGPTGRRVDGGTFDGGRPGIRGWGRECRGRGGRVGLAELNGLARGAVGIEHLSVSLADDRRWCRHRRRGPGGGAMPLRARCHRVPVRCRPQQQVSRCAGRACRRVCVRGCAHQQKETAPATTSTMPSVTASVAAAARFIGAPGVGVPSGDAGAWTAWGGAGALGAHEREARGA